MVEPTGKRLKSTFPICKTHGATTENFPAAVEESLCGVTTFLLEVAYQLEALAQIFKRRDRSLPSVAAFFTRESEIELKSAEAMMEYLNKHGGQYCRKDIQRPGFEHVGAVLPALELTLAQRREVEDVLVDLVQCAKEHGDAHTASVVKSRFLGPLAPRIKTLSNLVTRARKAGCAPDGSEGLGEYLFDWLEEDLTSTST